MDLTNQIINKAQYIKPLNNLTGLTILLFLCTASPAFGGLVRVSTDPGRVVGILPLSDNFSDFNSQFEAQFDINNDGIIEFVIPTKIQNDTNSMVLVTKFSDNRMLSYKLNIIPNEVTLASLESFDLPTFVADDPNISLVANLDIVNFLNEENFFTIGEQFNTDSNGIVSELTSTITFFDGSSLSDLDPEDRLRELLNSIDSLPVFGNSSIEVTAFDQFLSVPESSTSIGLGILAGLGITTKIKSKLVKAKKK